MMRNYLLLTALAAVLAAPFAAAQGSLPAFPTSLELSSDAKPLPPAVEGGEDALLQEPVFFDAPAQLITTPFWTRLLAKVPLASQLDRHLRVPEMKWDFNGNLFHPAIAITRGRKIFLAFTPPSDGKVVLATTKDLHKTPVEVQLTPDTRYKISLKINIFDPIGSKIVMEPAKDHKGKTHQTSGRDLQGHMRRYGVPVQLKDGPFVFLYGRDADEASMTMADTRSFFFVKDAGTKSKAYVTSEESVPVGQWTKLNLDGTEVFLFRPDAENVEIHQP